MQMANSRAKPMVVKRDVFVTNMVDSLPERRVYRLILRLPGSVVMQSHAVRSLRGASLRN